MHSFLFLLQGMRDLSSLTRIREPSPLHWKCGVLTTGHQGSPGNAFLLGIQSWSWKSLWPKIPGATGPLDKGVLGGGNLNCEPEQDKKDD